MHTGATKAIIIFGRCLKLQCKYMYYRILALRRVRMQLVCQVKFGPGGKVALYMYIRNTGVVADSFRRGFVPAERIRERIRSARNDYASA